MNLESRISAFRRALGTKIPESAQVWLIENGFLTAPASTRASHHGAYEGGLFDHSLAVTKNLVRMTNRERLAWSRPESPYIVGMLHDLCKIDQYRKLPEPDGDKVYEYVDTDIKGHGSKSVTYVSQLFDLTEEEIYCILYHMGAFTEKEEWKNYTDAIHKYPNVLWTHQADMLAAHVDKV